MSHKNRLTAHYQFNLYSFFFGAVYPLYEKLMIQYLFTMNKHRCMMMPGGSQEHDYTLYDWFREMVNNQFIQNTVMFGVLFVFVLWIVKYQYTAQNRFWKLYLLALSAVSVGLFYETFFILGNAYTIAVMIIEHASWEYFHALFSLINFVMFLFITGFVLFQLFLGIIPLLAAYFYCRCAIKPDLGYICETDYKRFKEKYGVSAEK